MEPPPPPPPPPPSPWYKGMVAVVTGANTGIGYEFVKKLAELGLDVVLTCRDATKGNRAVETLRSQGLDVRFCTLDLLDKDSIKRFVSWLAETIGGLDILVNNAGVSFKEIDENSVEHAETVIKTNYYGPKLLTESLLPLFRRSAYKSRILNISSRLGVLDKMRNPAMRKILQDSENLSEDRIDFVVQKFLEDVKNGVWEENGWPEYWTDYAVSKVAVTTYSTLLAKRHQGDGLCVNCFCPGFTQTAMTHGKGKYTSEYVASIGARLVLLLPHELGTGKFYVGSNSSTFSKL